MVMPHERSTAGDTTPDALRARFVALRRLSPQERLALMDDLTGLARTMAREGLRRRHPEVSETELQAMFAELVLGRELAARVAENHRDRRRESSE
jgi:hypothetical protein